REFAPGRAALEVTAVPGHAVGVAGGVEGATGARPYPDVPVVGDGEAQAGSWLQYPTRGLHGVVGGGGGRRAARVGAAGGQGGGALARAPPRLLLRRAGRRGTGGGLPRVGRLRLRGRGPR